MRIYFFLSIIILVSCQSNPKVDSLKNEGAEFEIEVKKLKSLTINSLRGISICKDNTIWLSVIGSQLPFNQVAIAREVLQCIAVH